MRKTKIVCTIGPASDSPKKLREMIAAGMNVARLNFAHGELEEHAERIRRVREAARELKQPVAILIDVKGPEIRIGKLKEESYELAAGETIVLTTEEIIGDKERVSVAYRNLPKDLAAGATILIDDGKLSLRVEKIAGTEIVCRIVNGGVLKGRKGVNVPGVRTSLSGVTEKDVRHILFGIEQGIDFIAQSFVRKAADVLEAKQILHARGANRIQLIAKIENGEGVRNASEILRVADGLMVARGDLGVDIPVEEVPLIQKEIIRKCNRAGKPVITATHMLESMMQNPRPTRAEASDVANAILDGSDAVMLSGETAAGKYPVESVATMARIAEKAEAALNCRERHELSARERQADVTEAIGQAVVGLALGLEAKAIVASTESGFTARMIAKHRPPVPVLAVTSNETVMRCLTLSWGVVPMLGKPVASTDDMFGQAVRCGQESGIASAGDTIVVTAGVPLGRSGTTNLIRVQKIGE